MAYTRPHRVPQEFEPDPRPDADSFVYCKGCGEPLPGEARHQPPRVKVVVMMCAGCRAIHGHPLIPRPGAPSFCYRCGTRDEILVERGTWPVTYHVCPRCLPTKAARYRAGNFTSVDPTPVIWTHTRR
jgi:hypothetical protein